MTVKPWLILTLRRTGGTSLTSFLNQISPFPTIEHEPFNTDRQLGHITVDFKKNRDRAAMAQQIEAALKKRPNIKHCFEIVPPELTCVLIEICQRLDYRFIVLTRRNEARRLGSLFVALSTGAWGPVSAAQIYPKIESGEIQAKPIDLKQVGQRVQVDAASLGRVLAQLRNRDADYAWHLFEDLYYGAVAVQDQARAIALDLGVEIGPDDPRLKAFSKRSGQNSAEIGTYIENYDAAMAVLTRLCGD